MIDFSEANRAETAFAEASRKRVFGTALAELALAVSLIVSIVVILALAGTSSAMAQAARSDIIMMEEGASSSLMTTAILIVIAIVAGALTILALRDVAPAHSKRSGNRRTTTTISRR